MIEKNIDNQNNMDQVDNEINVDTIMKDGTNDDIIDLNIKNIEDSDIFDSYELTDEDKEELDKQFADFNLNDARYTDISFKYKSYAKTLEELEENANSVRQYEQMKETYNKLQSTYSDEYISKMNKVVDFPNINNILTEEQTEFLESFKQSYMKSKIRLMYIMNKIGELLKGFEPQYNSTKFIIGEIKYSLERSLKSLEESKDNISEKDYKRFSEKIKICNDAINIVDKEGNYTFIKYIQKKWNKSNKKLISFFRRANKNNPDDIYNQCMKLAKGRVASKDMTDCLFYLQDKESKFGDPKFSLIFSLYIAEQIASGSTSGTYMYWKVLLIFIVNIYKDSYDYDTVNPICTKDSIKKYINEFYETYEYFASLFK